MVHIGFRLGKDPAQIGFRWGLQKSLEEFRLGQKGFKYVYMGS